MASNVKVVLNRSGVRALLTSAEVSADLSRRAGNIAARAGDGMETDEATGRNRARASVRTGTTAARKAEADRRALTSAIDAGRS